QPVPRRRRVPREPGAHARRHLELRLPPGRAARARRRRAHAVAARGGARDHLEEPEGRRQPVERVGPDGAARHDGRAPAAGWVARAPDRDGAGLLRGAGPIAMVTWYLGALAVLAAERLVELFISRRNAARAFARGGIEVGQAHFRVMALLHTVFLF